MKLRSLRTLATMLLAAGSSGCLSSGTFPFAHLTDVRLGEPNFRVVAVGVGGEASAEYVLGVSGAFFTEMQTLAVARIGGSPLLYQAALEDLWANFRAQYGAVEGRRLALVNVRFDANALNLLVYTRPRVSVRADVVEFAP